MNKMIMGTILWAICCMVCITGIGVWREFIKPEFSSSDIAYLEPNAKRDINDVVIGDINDVAIGDLGTAVIGGHYPLGFKVGFEEGVKAGVHVYEHGEYKDHEELIQRSWEKFDGTFTNESEALI